ncbi:hypothetical protein FOCC_FOCC011380 [Frankliniella occidentalis]|nr:hypothetical protein FOCC_FOCC011380 [Frankliniella occidentalis]
MRRPLRCPGHGLATVSPLLFSVTEDVYIHISAVICVLILISTYWKRSLLASSMCTRHESLVSYLYWYARVKAFQQAALPTSQLYNSFF